MKRACKQGWFLCTTPTKRCHSIHGDERAEELHQTSEWDFQTNPPKNRIYSPQINGFKKVEKSPLTVASWGNPKLFCTTLWNLKQNTEKIIKSKGIRDSITQECLKLPSETSASLYPRQVSENK